ncbi:MAG TPA: M57 family metalloprotease [Chitinophaga sp.]|uniref:M57 family metalloprotease n=1 Tax=Chitinophaga sp. TaxID=1869181 RepID=UPI002C857576|nr:M57 family metalloprotease [Chitinophaga sp.]HVI46389.1 M57 family metalloprotease [Chitinophaga sp.]
MKILKPVILVCALALTVIISCKKDTVQNESKKQNDIPESILSKIKSSGYSTDNVQRIGDGFLVENDILLKESDMVGSQNKLAIAKEEQYRTSAVVCGLPRTLTVRVTGFSNPNFATGTQQAIADYNALGLRLKFQYVTGSSADITISGQCLSGGILGYGGFPTGCNPYSTIVLNSCSSYFSTVCLIRKVVRHEIGHCIGFRHTDWMNRSYSCGSGGNEGTAGVGAIQIPGTPSAPDAGSWMLACANTACTGFNNNDIIALRYLFQ